jgi:hypothetical protein
MNTCPNCKQAEAINPLTKLTLGPVRTARCRHCQARLSVPLWSVILLVPIALVFMMPQINYLLAFVVVMAVVSAVWMVVPLVER